MCVRESERERHAPIDGSPVNGILTIVNYLTERQVISQL